MFDLVWKQLAPLVLELILWGHTVGIGDVVAGSSRFVGAVGVPARYVGGVAVSVEGGSFCFGTLSVEVFGAEAMGVG